MCRSQFWSRIFSALTDFLIDIAKCRLVKDSAAVSDLSRSAIVIKARPAELADGLCGLHCRRDPVSASAAPSSTFSSVLVVFDAFPSVTKPNPVFDSTVPAKHGVAHTVPTSGPPEFGSFLREA